MGSHKARREILGLDIIRFFSAVLVVGYHFGFIFWFSAAPAGQIMQLPSLAGDQLPSVWFGFIGVQIFFVISGFVISYSAERSNAFEFFRDRFVRLAPCLWICATLSLFIYVIFDIDGSKFRGYLKEITFYPFGPWLDIVVWTLGVEISFYACVFVLLSARRFAWIGYLAAFFGRGQSALPSLFNRHALRCFSGGAVIAADGRETGVRRSLRYWIMAAFSPSVSSCGCGS